MLAGGKGHNDFYFGKENGHDLITNFNEGDDIDFFNVSLADIQAAGVQEGNMGILLKDGSSLTMQNYSNQGNASFHLTDSSWSYNKETSSWVQTK